jgi:hypothetical protein
VHLQIFGGWQPPKIGTLFNSVIKVHLVYYKEEEEEKTFSTFY